jgi:hypothetical protein
MKKIILFTVLLMFIANIHAQQVSLYDSEGEARAYINFDKEATIFMWDGTPVAFIEANNNEICIFGFNGKFLGWFEDGIIYDKNGYAVVGARKGAINMVYKIERIKGVQKIVPIHPITPIAPIQPIWKNYWSNVSLTEFLYFGKK